MNPAPVVIITQSFYRYVEYQSEKRVEKYFTDNRFTDLDDLDDFRSIYCRFKLLQIEKSAK